MPFDVKTPAADTTFAVATGYLLGADTQASAAPSLFEAGAVATAFKSFTLGLGAISAAAWLTSAVQLAIPAATLTDTSSSGTVAAAYSNLIGASTIAASSATTFTDYYSLFIAAPIAGTNVTLGRKWSLGLGGGLQIDGAGAASTPASYWTGAIYAAGTGTTNFPHVFVQPTGATASTTWSTAGTVFGANVATGFAGNYVDYCLAGVSKFKVSSAGLITTPIFAVTSAAVFAAFEGFYATDGATPASGNKKIQINQYNGVALASDMVLNWSSSVNAASGFDVFVARDAANTLALRNSTNAQTLNVYNTYTNSTSYERLQFGFNSNIPFITSTPSGSGTQRALNLQRVATPASGSSSAAILLGTTAAFGIYYGSGAPTVTAAQGSIYLRSDGSGIADRFYVNTDGATTWTAFTSAA